MVNSIERMRIPSEFQRTPLLNEIFHSVDNVLLGKDWASVQVDMFVSPDRSVVYAASFVRRDDCLVTKFRFPYGQSQEVENAILGLYDVGLRRKNEGWNKARCVLFSDASARKRAHQFDCYFDPDYQWFTSLELESYEYACLDIHDELAIQAWEGLPKGAPRPWLNQRKGALLHG